MKVSVFVNLVAKSPKGTVVQASNGGDEGPPFVRFIVDPRKEAGVHIGKRYTITIEEA